MEEERKLKCTKRVEKLSSVTRANSGKDFYFVGTIHVLQCLTSWSVPVGQKRKR
jgi:hypothetical protein